MVLGRRGHRAALGAPKGETPRRQVDNFIWTMLRNSATRVP